MMCLKNISKLTASIVLLSSFASVNLYAATPPPPVATVLFVYSQAAVDASPGYRPSFKKFNLVATIKNELANASNKYFLNANNQKLIEVAYDNNSIRIRHDTDYNSVTEPLTYLQNKYGGKRKLLKADIVVFIIKTDHAFAGVALSPEAPLGKDAYKSGFAAVKGDSIPWALAHEIGHTMGLDHNVEEYGQVSKGLQYGYQYCSGKTAAQNFYTIMAYPCGVESIRANFLSTPNRMFNGRPAGNSTHAWQTKVLSENAAKVAAYQ